jgi:hypothetical protein
VLVTEREVYELRGEVEVALPVVIPEVAPLAARDRDWRDRVLHRPGIEDVTLRILDNLLPELGVDLDAGHTSIL